MESGYANSGRLRRSAAALCTAGLVALCVWAPIQRAHAVAAPTAEVCPPASAPPSPPKITTATMPPPAEILVCVRNLAITGALFTHWSEVASKSEGASKHPPGAREVAGEVLGFLISSDWVVEEAQALHVVLPARTVRRTFERIRAQQFPKPGEFGSFLSKSGQTVSDLLFRVRLNLLSARVQQHVLAGHHSARERVRALARFIRDFKRRGEAQTYCASEYAVVDCGHVVSPPL